MATSFEWTAVDLPLPPTKLIGREQACREIDAMLSRSDVRLITLTGPGGIGKTRLALHVAASLSQPLSDGIVLISLAALRQAHLVLPSIAQSVGGQESEGRSTRQSLDAALGDKQLLILLDNMEHLLEAAADIAWLLGKCPGGKILATSRAPLHIRGEHEYAVPTLPLPGDDRLDRLADNPAAQLFIDRASSVDAGFRLTAESAPTIAEICRRLDGLPLAIELAAARIKVLSPSALLARMDHRLPILVGGARDLPDRLRTMRDAIAWSYDLLTPDQQALFNRLSVFTGTFTLHEADTVAGDSLTVETIATEAPGGPSDLFEALSGLVGNSLLQQVSRDGEPRFLMLETIRDYGLDRLAAAGETDLLMDRHAEFFLSLAEAAMLRLRGAERTVWLERLEEAHGNLRTALAWTIDRADAERTLRLGGALWQFWWWRSHLSEGRQWLERAMALPDADDHPIALARTLTGIGALAETQGDYAVAEEYHARAAALWQESGDMHGLAVSLLFRWLVRFNADDQAGMEALSTESLSLFRALGDRWGTAMSLMELGVMAMRRRDHSAAEVVLAEGIELFEAISDRWGVAICRGVLANVATDQRDYARASSLLAESLSALLVLNDFWGVATVLPASARIAGEQRQWEWAVRISGAIARMHATMGAPLKLPFRVRFEQTLASARTALGDERFDAAWLAGEEMSPKEAVQEANNPPQTKPQRGATSEKAAHDLAIPLSPREREVLRLIPGRNAREIGESLFISESTVRTHIENILNKLGARNQKELIAMMYERGLV